MTAFYFPPTAATGTIQRRLAQLHCVKLLFVGLLSFAMLPFGSVARAEKPAKLSSGQIQQLILDGDRLVDQRDFQAALEKYTQAYLGVVSQIRGQDFLLPVTPSMFNREQLGLEMLALVDNEYTPDELRLMDASYKVLGLVPPELDSTKLMTDLLTEEVAGFYDPDNKRMVLIVEDDLPAPSWLDRLLGGGEAFNKDEQKTTLAHELTHALQDQLYDLNAMEEGIEDDDDMLLAFSALVEGDATLLMFAEAGDETDISKMDPETMRMSFNIMSWLLPLAGGESYRKAPPIFRDSLTFPYFQGMIFALTLAGEEGWKSVHQAYKNPPLSTEQILHPAKYFEQVDKPQRVLLPDFEADLPEGWKQLGGNCLGELQTCIMLKKVRGGSAASVGWNGDRYLVFEHPESGNLALVYVSIWDSQEDAQEFAAAFRAYRNLPPENDPTLSSKTESKNGDEKVESVAEATAAVTTAATTASESSEDPKNERDGSEGTSEPPLTVFAADAVHQVQLHGDQVWVVEGFNQSSTERFLAKLAETRFEEKSFPLPSLQKDSEPAAQTGIESDETHEPQKPREPAK